MLAGYADLTAGATGGDQYVWTAVSHTKAATVRFESNASRIKSRSASEYQTTKLADRGTQQPLGGEERSGAQSGPLLGGQPPAKAVFLSPLRLSGAALSGVSAIATRLFAIPQKRVARSARTEAAVEDSVDKKLEPRPLKH